MRTAGRRRPPAQPSSGGGGRPVVRHCAVYTRKSSEEGLEQEYNSLHAQREACEAYIRSQQHEGWRLVPAPFDDGGLSGGSMARPALQALLAEVRAGRVDVIVVYKVDRLTRSLADFAKMVELFDAAGASFVAVTQQFNTTTSMGRLTLNVLLSFAQFEREVTSERIRDKIAASKRRGMWMGGRTPLGYAVRDRRLVADPEAAPRVVQLFERYLALGSVAVLKAELDADAAVGEMESTRGRTDRVDTDEPNVHQPASRSRGALYALLGNPVYIGQVRHKGECHPGQHDGIVPPALFTAVQARLAASNNGEKGHTRSQVEASRLAGKLFDQAGERLVPSHARKGERRYRYYVSRSLVLASKAGQAEPAASAPATLPGVSPSMRDADGRNSASPELARAGWRLPAHDIERNVATAVAAMLGDEGAIVSAALAAGMPADAVPLLRREIGIVAGAAGGGNGKQADALFGIVERVEVSTGGLALTLTLPIPAAAGTSQPTNDAPSSGNPNSETLDHPSSSIQIERFVPHRIRQRGVEMRLVLEGGIAASQHDPALLKVVARAHCWFEDLVQGRAASAKELAQHLGVDVRYVQRLLRLAMLAPSLVEAIAAGRQDAGLTVDALAERGPLPLHWSEQVELLRG